MSREIRRVPLDFDFPIGETWTGYLRPDNLALPDCEPCLGTGSSPSGQWVESIASLLLMVGEDVEAQRRGRNLHPYLSGLENRPYVMRAKSDTNPHNDDLLASFDAMADAEQSGDASRITAAAARCAEVRKRHREWASQSRCTFINPRPGQDAVDLSTGLAGRSPGFMGHDAIDRWSAAKKILTAAGLPEDWGTCAICEGHGYVATDEQQAAHDAWTETPPPAGEGYQLWQTVSEGGPCSPVFATPDELADWIIASGKSLHGANTPREQLIAWIAREGTSLGSFIHTPETGIVSGVEAAAGRDS